MGSDGEPEREMAGRVAAVLFAVAGLIAYAEVVLTGSRSGALLAIGTVDLAIAGIAWWVPWERVGRLGLLTLALVGLAVIGGAMWATGAEPVGFVPFFVLLFVWIGLYLSRWTGLWLSPAAAAAYLVPLIAAGAPGEQLGSVVVVVPVAVVVAEVIARKVASLHDALDQVERSERWRADVMSTLAHDVRSPLTAVEGALQLLDQRAEQLDVATRRRILDAAFRQIRRIKRLAAGLLDLDRVEAGTLQIDCQAIQVADAAADAASYVGDLDVRIAISPGLQVWADPDRLEQILVNLLTNALRHGRPPIELTADSCDGHVEIAVRDHGPGIPADARQALFERFSTDDTAPGSVGLGLWIVRQLTEAHGGHISYQPADPGALFTVNLPQPPRQATSPITRTVN